MCTVEIYNNLPNLGTSEQPQPDLEQPCTEDKYTFRQIIVDFYEALSIIDSYNNLPLDQSHPDLASNVGLRTSIPLGKLL